MHAPWVSASANPSVTFQVHRTAASDAADETAECNGGILLCRYTQLDDMPVGFLFRLGETCLSMSNDFNRLHRLLPTKFVYARCSPVAQCNWNIIGVYYQCSKELARCCEIFWLFFSNSQLIDMQLTSMNCSSIHIKWVALAIALITSA